MSAGEATPLRRLPIESNRPVAILAGSRLGLTLTAIAMVVALDLHRGGLLAVLGLVALPWSIVNLVLARRAPELAISPLIATGDMAVLLVVEATDSELYTAVRFMAIAFLAVHAHFLGERVGMAIAAVASAGFVGLTAIDGAGPVTGRLLVLSEVMFVAAAVSATFLVGAFRSVESASRLRARELTRRTMRRDSEIRRQISEALHDGPVQEMIGLDMALAAAAREAEGEDAPRTRALLEEAQAIAERNVKSLRDEMTDLGPYAVKEMSFEAALERCRPVWERRYGLRTTVHVDLHELPSEAEGDLFRVTQEAVTNAAKHGSAQNVSISLTGDQRRIELSVVDDGDGFGDVDPLTATEAGHIGLASMRERAELLKGTLSIESSDEGATVTLRAPRPAGGTER